MEPRVPCPDTFINQPFRVYPPCPTVLMNPPIPAEVTSTVVVGTIVFVFILLFIAFALFSLTIGSD